MDYIILDTIIFKTNFGGLPSAPPLHHSSDTFEMLMLSACKVGPTIRTQWH